MSQKTKPSFINQLPVPVELIERRIYLIRGHKVMLDSDLAELYHVPTKRLNEAVKRNRDRFPADFMFQLTKAEADSLRFQFGISNLRSQFATSSKILGGRRYLPYAFTEHGVAMLSSVLNSKRAVQMNILIIRAFVKLRELLSSSKEMAHRLEAVERTLKRQGHVIAVVYDEVKKLRASPPIPKRRIGFRSPDEKP